jgi:hypothetical protein
MYRFLFILLMFLFIPIISLANPENQKIKLKIVIVQSYNINHVCGEPQLTGILQSLKEHENLFSYTIKLFYMNSRYTNILEYAKKESAKEIYKQIEKNHPDVIFIVDDNAFKYLTIPYLIDKGYNIYFSGLNKPLSKYIEEYPVLKFVINKLMFGVEEYLVLDNFFNFLNCVNWEYRNNIYLLYDDTPTSIYLKDNWLEYFKKYNYKPVLIKMETIQDVDNFFRNNSDEYIIIVNTLQDILNIKIAESYNKPQMIIYLHDMLKNKGIQVTTNISSIKYGADIVSSIDFTRMGYLAAQMFFDNYMNKKTSGQYGNLTYLIINQESLNSKSFFSIPNNCYEYIDIIK